MNKRLSSLLEASASRWPDRSAVEDAERDVIVNYADLDSLSSELRDMLSDSGVRRGDRVGICAPKSIGTVASIFGILKTDAAYVPVDATAPSQRNASIFEDCTVRAIVADKQLVGGLSEALGSGRFKVAAELGPLAAYGADLVLLEGTNSRNDEAAPEGTTAADQLAYILYTSGSTGKPKGVVHTHSSAISFVDWCSATFEPTEQDRFSSHAPFHFDLSILDLYVPLKHGAAFVLFGEDLGKVPPRLGSVAAERQLSIWYSTPSVLRLLVEFGRLDRYDWSSLRTVLFAGEVFPIKHLRALKAAWPQARYFNLYGPTETNVCTYFEVPADIPESREDPFPIGIACSNDRTLVLDEHCNEVERGEEGELYVSGGTVMQGYWNLPERTEAAFLTDPDGVRWYKTGDVVKEAEDGDFIFLGRRDRMVKKRGYRIELGEIESALYRHPAVLETAAVAVQDDDGDVLVKAYLSCSGDERPSRIELKGWCAANLPLYMVPDQFAFLDSIPKTSTDKIDYQTLNRIE